MVAGFSRPITSEEHGDWNGCAAETKWRIGSNQKPAFVQWRERQRKTTALKFPIKFMMAAKYFTTETKRINNSYVLCAGIFQKIYGNY